MGTHDINGREYARLSTVKSGDKLEVDGGFDCMSEGTVRIVHTNDKGELYVPCDEGEHCLDGQLDDDNNDSLIGLYPVALSDRGEQS